MTRCVDFTKVKFYNNPTFDKHLGKNMIMRYLKNKVDGCKTQARRSHREIDESKQIAPNGV